MTVSFSISKPLKQACARIAAFLVLCAAVVGCQLHNGIDSVDFTRPVSKTGDVALLASKQCHTVYHDIVELIGIEEISDDEPSSINGGLSLSTFSASPVSQTLPAMREYPAIDPPLTSPALPENCWTDCVECNRFKNDMHGSLTRLRDDATGIVNWNNALILGTALGGAIGIHQDLDGQVRANTARHPKRWGSGSEFLGEIGDYKVQVPVLLGLYAYSLHREDDELHDLMSTLLSSYTIVGLSTLSIKTITDTDRPSRGEVDGRYGFPSHHAASGFAIAAVLDEYYGAKAGIPAYLTAGLIGFSRIDERDHDLSDVVFGAVLGYVIGKSVAGRHLHGDSRVRLLPYTHPVDGSSGLRLEFDY